jgi:hypothetical protein
MTLMYLLIFAMGCGSCFEPAPTADEALIASLDGGWPDVIVRQPPAFRAFTEGPEHQGWAHFYHGELVPAAKLLTGVPKQRVVWEQAQLALDIERLATRTFQMTYESWASSEAMSSSSAIPVAAALAAIDRSSPTDAASWIEQLGRYHDPALTLLAQSLTPTGLKPSEAGGDSYYLDCVRAHLSARAEADLSLLAPCGGANATVLFEGSTASGHGQLHNPLLYPTLARVAEARADGIGKLDPSDAQEPGLPYLLFSGDWNLADLGATLRGQSQPTLSAFQLSELSTRSDDVDAARTWIGRVDAHLDLWHDYIINDATEEGRQIAFDVQPLEIYRAHLLQKQARQSIESGYPNQAIVFLNAATNIDKPRQIGAQNRASFFALRAEARLMAGRTREALDDLRIIAEVYPALDGLRETMNDLSIMQNSTRTGDSKEN